MARWRVADHRDRSWPPRGSVTTGERASGRERERERERGEAERQWSGAGKGKTGERAAAMTPLYGSWRERERERESCVGGEMKISIPSNRFSSKRKKMEKKKKEKW